MSDEKRKQEAQKNVTEYLREGLLKKEHNDLAKEKYQENAQLSLRVAQELSHSEIKPHLWIIVTSYYAMFYSANAVLLHLGYKTQDKIAHKVTNDALIVFVEKKLTKTLLDDYERIQEDALAIAGTRAESIIETYAQELHKRSLFQYNMLEETKANKAETSLQRAIEFVFEMNRLLKERL